MIIIKIGKALIFWCWDWIWRTFGFEVFLLVNVINVGDTSKSLCTSLPISVQLVYSESGTLVYFLGVKVWLYSNLSCQSSTPPRYILCESVCGVWFVQSGASVHSKENPNSTQSSQDGNPNITGHIRICKYPCLPFFPVHRYLADCIIQFSISLLSIE